MSCEPELVGSVASILPSLFDLCKADCTNRYHTDPSGTFMKYDAKAIGSGSEAAQSELQDKWHKVRFLYSFLFLTCFLTVMSIGSK